MNVRLAERDLKTKFGTFREILYYDGKKEAIALVMDDVAGKENVLCRVHSDCMSGHVFNSIECDCREQMELAQFRIEQNGAGVIIWLDQEGKGNGHLALIKSAEYKLKGVPQPDAYVAAGYKKDARSYAQAAEILRDLNVKSITLLANNSGKMDDLRKESIEVSGIKELGIENEELGKIFEEKVRGSYLMTDLWRNYVKNY
jgi:GTP cyclohydrolase II